MSLVNLREELRKRWIWIAMFVSLAVIWGAWPRGDSSSDQSSYRQYRNAARYSEWCHTAEKHLPVWLSEFLRLEKFEWRYRNREEFDRKALLKCGYLVEVPVMVTNLTMERRYAQTPIQTLKALRRAESRWFLGYDIEHHIVRVTCRPQDESICRELLKDQ